MSKSRKTNATINTSTEETKVTNVTTEETTKQEPKTMSVGIWYTRNVSNNPAFNAMQKGPINRLMKNNLIDLETLQLIANPEIPIDNMVIIANAVEAGFTLEELAPMVDPDRNYVTLNFLYERTLIRKENAKKLEEQKRLEEIESKRTYMQKELIRWASMEHISDECKSIIANPDFNEQQTFEVFNGLIYSHLNVEQVKSYAKPEIPAEEMRQKREEFMA